MAEIIFPSSIRTDLQSIKESIGIVKVQVEDCITVLKALLSRLPDPPSKSSATLTSSYMVSDASLGEEKITKPNIVVTDFESENEAIAEEVVAFELLSKGVSEEHSILTSEGDDLGAHKVFDEMPMSKIVDYIEVCPLPFQLQFLAPHLDGLGVIIWPTGVGTSFAIEHEVLFTGMSFIVDTSNGIGSLRSVDTVGVPLHQFYCGGKVFYGLKSEVGMVNLSTLCLKWHGTVENLIDKGEKISNTVEAKMMFYALIPVTNMVSWKRLLVMFHMLLTRATEKEVLSMNELVKLLVDYGIVNVSSKIEEGIGTTIYYEIVRKLSLDGYVGGCIKDGMGNHFMGSCFYTDKDFDCHLIGGAYIHGYLCEITRLNVAMEIQQHYSEVMDIVNHSFVKKIDSLSETCEQDFDIVDNGFPFKPGQGLIGWWMVKTRAKFNLSQWPESLKNCYLAALEEIYHSTNLSMDPIEYGMPTPAISHYIPIAYEVQDKKLDEADIQLLEINKNDKVGNENGCDGVLAIELSYEVIQNVTSTMKLSLPRKTKDVERYYQLDDESKYTDEVCENLMGQDFDINMGQDCVYGEPEEEKDHDRFITDQSPYDIDTQSLDFINLFTAERFLFQRQWLHIHSYTNMQGIYILGDMPMDTGCHRGDVWTSKKNFLLNRSSFIFIVIWVPSDAFSAHDQCWGNPLYDLKAMGKMGYVWDVDDLEALERDVSEESSWKLVHGYVFRTSRHLVILLVVEGSAAPLALLVLLVILLEKNIQMLYVGRRVFVTTFIVCYALTSFISSYVCGGIYSRLGGNNRTTSIILTSSLFLFLCLGIEFVLNTTGIFYGYLLVVSLVIIVVVFVTWAFIPFSLAPMSSIAGMNCSGAPNNPCHVKTFSRPIPKKKWYLTPYTVSTKGGRPLFGNVSIEIYLVFTYFWNYKVCYVYDFMLLVFLILIIVTICVITVGIYFLLNIETYHWQWTPFFSTASTIAYVDLYLIYYYYEKTKMFGFFRTSFYFDRTNDVTLDWFSIRNTLYFNAFNELIVYFAVRKQYLDEAYCSVHFDTSERLSVTVMGPQAMASVVLSAGIEGAMCSETRRKYDVCCLLGCADKLCKELGMLMRCWLMEGLLSTVHKGLNQILEDKNHLKERVMLRVVTLVGF